MRKKIIVGNWKMNLNYAEALTLVDSILARSAGEFSCDVILAPAYIYLCDVLTRIQRAPDISLAAQNCSEHAKGAFTGEVSASMLASIGAEYVIIGHSERRTFFNDNHPVLLEKIHRLLENSLIPIYCCGETIEERNTGKHFEQVRIQLMDCLFKLNQEQFKHCLIAYEPVWAIGTGVTATTGQVQEMHSFIRKEAEQKYGKGCADELRILYGGSVNQKNAADLFACPDVDGALAGGSSLRAEEFISIIRSAGG